MHWKRASTMNPNYLVTQDELEPHIPEELLDVLARRLERQILYQHLRRFGLLSPALFFFVLLLRPTAGKLDAQCVPVQNVSMHPFECSSRRICSPKAYKAESHTQTRSRTLRIWLRLNAGKGKAGEVAERVRKALRR